MIRCMSAQYMLNSLRFLQSWHLDEFVVTRTKPAYNAEFKKATKRGTQC